MSDCVKKSRCNGDRRNNCWVEGPVDPITGEGGVCLLDNLSEEDIISVLEVMPMARQDLLKVTTDADLLALANNITSLSTQEEMDVLQNQVNRHAESIPMYTQFNGQGPWNGGK